ncbi:MAG: hypothetical protein NC418_10370 [Muribaculaceae bacterium]|nr:hypothetical protein [Muribaculaceae bacterium]
MKIPLAALLLGAATIANAATISRAGSQIKFSADTPYGNMATTFRRCMANELFTFYNVLLDGVEVNSTQYSNNIGGFLAEDRWIGGNHNDGKPNAFTVSVDASVDGKPLREGDTIEGAVLRISVVNRLFYDKNTQFCSEHITYTVSGNSIEVDATHHYTMPRAIEIDRYYGMQSVFIDEHEILTPGAGPLLWNKIDSKDIRITKASAPLFSTFIEHSSSGYQATYMSRTDLGDRSWVNDSDLVFIGNSYTKSYHKIIGKHTIEPGESSHWHGIYTWFTRPLTDSNDSFAYVAYIDGKPVEMRVDAKGEMRYER